MANKVELLEKVDWVVLNDYIETNRIMSSKHPEYDIWILNYSPKTQMSRVWDEYTLSCRGLVVDAEGNILARPFQKFKNYEEYNPADIDMSQDYELFEKMDGSLGILFFYEATKEWIMASRGSFISEQAVEAHKMLDRDINVVDRLDKKNTYVFEIIYPLNIIVVNYHGMYDLILLAIIETKTGNEANYNHIACTYSKLFKIVKKYNLPKVKDLMELKLLEEENREGFVVRFTNGFRVKIKFSEYIRLHRILTNVSNVTIWEYLVNKNDLDDLLDKVPDEFYSWLRRTIRVLEDEFRKKELRSLKEFVRIYYNEGITSRREFAEAALKSDMRAILFKHYDKKPYDDIIWKMCKPKWSKPFADGYVDDNS